jgi:hypothetical protein
MLSWDDRLDLWGGQLKIRHRTASRRPDPPYNPAILTCLRPSLCGISVTAIGSLITTSLVLAEG